ncbi:zinc ribbon domain-containing protein, partial [Methanobrevibacter sp.]|uniref:zinc ribbon domain-containing protein n=1 Tax=Methanobrevibacter sp. TaxID=66852 RepID=UPI003890D8C6
EINENHLKNLVLCIFLGVISLVLVMNLTYEIWVSLIISSLIIGFLAKGLGLFEKFDDAITAAIYSFIATFIAFYVFVPFASWVAADILIWACISAVIAAIISLIKLYFIKQGNEDSQIKNNLNKIAENIVDFKDCPECGAKIKKDAKFCEKCGSKIEDVETEVLLCKKCGAKIEKDAEFCDSCGTKTD